jgi:hypothetical protein
MTHTIINKRMCKGVFMPSIVGNLKINSIGSSGVVNIGDSMYISPSSSAKTYAGAGSFNTGDFGQSNNTLSATNTSDPDISDQNTSK